MSTQSAQDAAALATPVQSVHAHAERAPRRRAVEPIVLGVGFAILVAICASTAWLVTRFNEDAAMVEHTLEIEARISNLALDVRRAESGQRGYLLTGRDEYLDDYRSAVGAVERDLTALRTGIADNPEQQSVLADMNGVIRQKMDELAETVRLRQDGETERALAIVNSGLGKRLMDQIRAYAQQMTIAEQKLHESRSEASRATNVRLLLLEFAGIAAVLLLAGASILSVRRSLAESVRAQNDLAAVNLGLEDTIAERTTDLREANEEIQRFAYIVSHDLRSPLVNIMGFTSELQELRVELFQELARLRGEVPDSANRDATLSKDFDEAIEFIRASTGKMDRLINAVLRLSREGKRQFTPERIDMTALIKNIVGSMAHQAEERGATLSVAELPQVASDRLALEQVFSNLMDNALKYLRKGVPGEIAVSGRTTPLQLIYEVRDNGRGIAPDDFKRVFELFRRAGAQDTHGEGIGLAHVRALVRRLGGTMGLKSQVGEGSTFTVTLPRYFRAEREETL